MSTDPYPPLEEPRRLGAAPWVSSPGDAGRPEEVRNTLAAWGLVGGQDVEVELLVVSGVGAVAQGPRLVEGTIAGATGNVLVLTAVPGARTVRVPWHAIATIRDRVTAPPHPAL